MRTLNEKWIEQIILFLSFSSSGGTSTELSLLIDKLQKNADKVQKNIYDIEQNLNKVQYNITDSLQL